MNPTAGQVLLACLAVAAGCLACAYALWAAAGSGNWLWLFSALGSAGLVAGVVGQRAYPSEDLVKALGADGAGRTTPGPWDAGVKVPLVDLHLTPVAVGGLLVTIAGLSLVLFFEVVPEAEKRRPPRALAALDDDDAA